MAIKRRRGIVAVTGLMPSSGLPIWRADSSQAISYSLDICGVCGAPSETGTSRLIAALGMALIVAALAVAVYALLHTARERQLIGAVEAEDDRRQREDEERQERERKRGKPKPRNSAR